MHHLLLMLCGTQADIAPRHVHPASCDTWQFTKKSIVCVCKTLLHARLKKLAEGWEKHTGSK